MENRFSPPGNIYLIMAMLTLAAGLAVSFFYIRSNSNRPELLLSPSVSAKVTPSLGVVKSVLLAKTLIKFPDIISSSVISADKLPEDLKVFLFKEAFGINAKTLQYEKNAKGYQIDYIINTPWIDTYYKFTTLTFSSDSAKWRRIFNERANLFAVVEMENTQYQVRVNQILGENNQVLISIQIIAK